MLVVDASMFGGAAGLELENGSTVSGDSSEDAVPAKGA